MIRQRLAEYYTKIQILRINGLRTLSAHARPASTDPAIAALGATNKMFWSEMHQRAMELALDIFGADGDARSTPARRAGRGRARCATSGATATRCRR